MFSLVTGKGRYTGEFDKERIVVSRCLEASISEKRSWSIVIRAKAVSICREFINDGEPSTRLQGIGDHHLIENSGHRKLSLLAKSN
ncbi:hypothetical protein AVEN_143872-1 [Araneus ventricosus]|uniref:Uncharacterized protein n=1 Tax=Araneus ventricosus TaxID=182803 RepID=A0A4Y2J7X2_ARAVE|nr:hypothetical protein AVEN_143872-1 [Araneus ventricosus]